jgi:sterol desaturase/sphingolipid hydroxylase (fatty acid hydroxylase superfamily)
LALRWLLASPEFHHWHHSNHREARNKNFAGQVPVLDYIFGTLHLPRGRKPTKYGLDQPIPQTYAGAAALSVSQSFHVGAYAAAVTLTRYHLAAGDSVAWEIAWRSREDYAS